MIRFFYLKMFIPRKGASMYRPVENNLWNLRNLRLIGMVEKFNPFAKDNRHRCIRATIPVVRRYEGRRWLDERLR